MKKYYAASSLMVPLVMLSGIALLLFLNKERVLQREKISQYDYQHYIFNRFQLISTLDTLDMQQACEIQQKEKINIVINRLSYSFLCENRRLFVAPSSKIAKNKYVMHSDLTQLINFDYFQHDIIEITSLAELPESSEQNPRVVKLLNPIDNETLEADFYGLVISEYPLTFKGKRIFGSVYSTLPSTINTRNSSYKANVIAELDRRYSTWHAQPHSRTILNAD